jgi:tetratricopeptide (TPR) repeat protein
MLGKYGEGPDAAQAVVEAERAFARAFELNPDLSLAHNLVTYGEVDTGRARDAMSRLLDRLRQRSSDPELYAGLVHACRYCGLLEASIAADAHARRLDPGMQTSVAHTFFVKGDYERAMARDTDNPAYLTLLSLVATGRRSEALSSCIGIDLNTVRNRRLATFTVALRAMLEGNVEQGRTAVRHLQGPGFTDPEGWFYWAHLLAGLGDAQGALSMVTRAAEGGWSCADALDGAPGLETVRNQPGYRDVVERARATAAAAAEAFESADGPRLLGIHSPSSSSSPSSPLASS